MVKKIIVTVLAFMTGILIFAGCGSNKEEQKDNEVIPYNELIAADSFEMPEETDAASENSAVKVSGDEIDINEKMYVTWINEIYTNTDNYLGKTIRLEGMYTAETVEETNKSYYYVYRQGPGCCGNDGSMCGFEFTFDGTMPKENDWIEVTGVLERYEEDGAEYLSLKASKVEVKSERGKEVVSQ